MADYNDLDDAGKAVVNEVLKKYGITPPSTTQTVLQGAGSTLGAGADAAAANRSAGVDAAALAERLNQAMQSHIEMQCLRGKAPQ